MTKRLILLLSISVSIQSVYAQLLPTGTIVLEDYYRRQQLIGKTDSTLSFCVRPNAIGSGDVYNPESKGYSQNPQSTSGLVFARGKGLVHLLPLTWLQQYNSNHPYGWNDGPMIPAKGYQTLVSGGVFVKYGILSIQLQPQFVYASNPPFNGFADARHDDENYKAYYDYYNQIDWPERYGRNAYSKAFWGQSYIKLTFGAFSVGLSNENLWWGPGIKNALIISDNAPGFKHVSINTEKPVKTFLGYFEGQIIGGRLDGSGLPPLLDVTTLADGTNLYSPKLNDWRYFTGFNVNYHPKWVPGLVLGLTRTFDAYHQDVKGLNGYIPFFTPYQKAHTDNGDPFPRDQYTSFYSRWLFRKANAEIYFEYGLNDNSYNIRDFIGSPDHSRAYIFGFQKMIPLKRYHDQYILFSTEITQLSQSPDRIVRDAEGWYMHGAVRDGQTNEGQILGAGIGSGGNLQSADISWVSGLNKLGIEFERYEHSVDFSNNAFKDINNHSRKWVDFGLALEGSHAYKNILVHAKLQGIRSLNYEWILKNYDAANDFYIPNNDIFNLHLEIGAMYRF